MSVPPHEVLPGGLTYYFFYLGDIEHASVFGKFIVLNSDSNNPTWNKSGPPVPKLEMLLFLVYHLFYFFITVYYIVPNSYILYLAKVAKNSMIYHKFELVTSYKVKKFNDRVSIRLNKSQ